MIIKPMWVLELTPAKARIVLKALRGNLTEEEQIEARNFGNELTEQRMVQTKGLADSMKLHFDNMKKEEEV